MKILFLFSSLLLPLSGFAMDDTDFNKSGDIEDRRLPWQKSDSLFETQVKLLSKLAYDADDGFINGFYRYRNFTLGKCAKGRKHAAWATAATQLMDKQAGAGNKDGLNLQQQMDTNESALTPKGIDGFGDHDTDADTLIASVNDCTSSPGNARRYVNSQLEQNQLAKNYLHDVFGEAAGASQEILAGLRSAKTDCDPKSGPGAAGAEKLEQSLGRFQFVYGEADENLTRRAKALSDMYAKLIDLGEGPAKCTFMPWRHGKFLK
jgi:hypothetical protein